MLGATLSSRPVAPEVLASRGGLSVTDSPVRWNLGATPAASPSDPTLSQAACCQPLLPEPPGSRCGGGFPGLRPGPRPVTAAECSGGKDEVALGLFGRMLRQCGWVGGPGATRGDIPGLHFPPIGGVNFNSAGLEGSILICLIFFGSISFYLEKQSKITWKKNKNLLQPAKSYFIDLSLTPNIIFS